MTTALSYTIDHVRMLKKELEAAKQRELELLAVIKELREALTSIVPMLDSYWHCSDIDVIHAVLAKTEHHNSRALEKMLLEARIDELSRLPVNEPCRYASNRAIEYLQSKLAELNKE